MSSCPSARPVNNVADGQQLFFAVCLLIQEQILEINRVRTQRWFIFDQVADAGRRTPFAFTVIQHNRIDGRQLLIRL